MNNILIILLVFSGTATFSQEYKVSYALFDGVIIGGYVDHGAFLNFTGPNLNATCRHSKFIFGMLPSLRFKKDHGTPKNAFVTPNLGIGCTYIYKMWAAQSACYYNGKTATENGQWHIGLGVGLRLNGFNKKK